MTNQASSEHRDGLAMNAADRGETFPSVEENMAEKLLGAKAEKEKELRENMNVAYARHAQQRNRNAPGYAEIPKVFLKREDASTPAASTELQLQRQQFEQAVAALAGIMGIMPALLAPVMRPAGIGEDHAGEIGLQPANTPLGAWLAIQTGIVNGMSRDLAALVRRIDL